LNEGTSMFQLFAFVIIFSACVNGQSGVAPVGVEGIVVDQSSGAPIRNATVACEAMSATTSSDGKFLLAPSQAGYCTLAASAPGFLETAASKLAIEFTAGSVHAPVTLKMIRPAHLRGKVEDREHHPIAGVRVHALRSVRAPGGGKIFQTVVTSTSEIDGSFTLSPLLPDSYILLASPPDVQTGIARADSSSRFGLTFYPISSSLDGAIPISFSAGDDQRNLSFELVRTRLHKVSGVVLSDEASRGSKHGIKLELRRRWSTNAAIFIDPIRTPLQQPFHELRLSPTGSFEIEGVEEGSYMLSYRTGSTTYPGIALDIGDRDLTRVELRIPRHTKIHGTVQILNAPKEPSGDLAVSLPKKMNLVRIDSGRLQHTYIQVGDGGRFEVNDIGPGRYRVVLFHRGATSYVKDVEWNGTRTGEAYFDNPSLTEGELQIFLSADMATLTGQAPVGAASVVVIAENFEELDELDGRLRHAEVDGRRVFQLEHVPPGTYHVCGMATRGKRPVKAALTSAR
jgi:hypothetical protein